MIHLARPTVPLVITIFTWKVFRFERFWKIGAYVQTDKMKWENNYHYRPSGSKSICWIMLMMAKLNNMSAFILRLLLNMKK